MKTEKYEFYHQSNLIQLGNLIDDLHGVHVHLLMLQRRYYRIYGKYASFSRICGHITKLKQRTKPHWNQLPSQVIQQVAKRIHLGYEKFFENIKDRKAGKTKRKVGRPKIKPNHKYNSLTFTQAGLKIEGNRLRINCLGKSFTFWKHRDWTGRIKTVTIKRDTVGDYSLYIACEDCEPSEKLPLTGNVAGADFGCKTLWTFAKHGKTFLKAGRWEATTKPCSACGHHNENLTLQDRQWICPECGSHHDRDLNAAINILQAGVPAQQCAIKPLDRNFVSAAETE